MQKMIVSIGLILLGFSGVYAGHERPLVTENADITPYGDIEMRVGVEYLQGETLMFKPAGQEWDITRLPVLGFSVGLGERIEVQADYDALYLKGEPKNGYNTGDLRLWTKIKLFSEQGKMPAIAFKFGTKLPNAGNARNFGTDESDNFGLLILSKHFGDLESRLNLGMGILGSPNQLSTQDDVLIYGLGVVKPIYGDIKAVGEVTGITNSHNGNDRASLRAGFQIPQNRITWDIAISKGLNNQSEDWGITAGATFTFQAFGK
jgi:hypothetical protein